MKYSFTLLWRLVLIISAVFNLGCKDSTQNSNSGPKANFKVQLDNLATPLIDAGFLPMAASSLRAKLGGVDLLNECTNGAPPGNCIAQGKDPDPDIWVTLVVVEI